MSKMQEFVSAHLLSVQERQKQLMKCCEVDKKVQNPLSKNVLEMLIKYSGVWLDE